MNATVQNLGSLIQAGPLQNAVGKKHAGKWAMPVVTQEELDQADREQQLQQLLDNPESTLPEESLTSLLGLANDATNSYKEILGPDLDGLVDTELGQAVDTNVLMDRSIDYSLNGEYLLEALSENGSIDDSAQLPEDLLAKYNISNVSTVGELKEQMQRLEDLDSVNYVSMLDPHTQFMVDGKPYGNSAAYKAVELIGMDLGRDMPEQAVADTMHTLAMSGYSEDVLMGMDPQDMQSLLKSMIRELPEGRAL